MAKGDRRRTRTIYVAVRSQNRWDWLIEISVVVSGSILATLILAYAFHV